MKITPVNKLPYDGPKTHYAILKKIHEEAQAQGKDISFNYIQRTVYLFFGYNGFPRYFRLFESFAIKGIGRWVLTWHARKAHNRIVKYRRTIRRRKSNKSCDQKKIRVRFFKKFMAYNEKIVAEGFKPWEWRTFCTVHDRRKLIKWGYHYMKKMNITPINTVSSK